MNKLKLLLNELLRVVLEFLRNTHIPTTPTAVGIGILILLQSINATSVIINMMHSQHDPIIVIDSKILNPVVKFGDPLLIIQTFKRTVYCKSDIDRFIFKLPDYMLVRRERLPSGVTLIGTSTATVQVPTKFPSQTVIPLGIADPMIQDLFPGNTYLIRELVHSDCGDRMHTSLLPDLEFTVQP